MMKTPIPAQLEHWLNIVNNKRSPQDLKAQAILHLTNIRDTINESLKSGNKQGGQKKNENSTTR
jgi:hypothetical protein